MSNITVGQIIMDAQRIASRVKDLDALSSALLEEAEGNNRFVESLRQFQDDIESLNRISNNKTNADMVNRIQQQNVSSSEILKENRELKICIEDYERAMELMMQKYREHTNNKIFDSKINFKEIYNEKLWSIIREQREKITEMAAVMQRAASADDDNIQRELQIISRLRMENETLRELLQISKQYGSAQCPIRINEHLLEEKAVQTETDDSADELSLSGASTENVNNNTVIQLYNNSSSISNNISTASLNTIVAVASTVAAPYVATDNLPANDNNNGPSATAANITNCSSTLPTAIVNDSLPMQKNEENSNRDGIVSTISAKVSAAASAT